MCRVDPNNNVFVVTTFNLYLRNFHEVTAILLQKCVRGTYSIPFLVEAVRTPIAPTTTITSSAGTSRYARLSTLRQWRSPHSGSRQPATTRHPRPRSATSVENDHCIRTPKMSSPFPTRYSLD